MCLYIITQQTGAALHIAQDEREIERERERVFIITFHVSIRGRVHVHAAHGTLYTQFFLKSILTLFHSFQKPTADVSLQKNNLCKN